MRVANFSLLIPEGRERDCGHVEMAHGAVYRLRLCNHNHSLRCDAVIMVDGKDMGTYRIERHGEITLERSYYDSGRFTFFKTDSEEGQAAGAGGVGRDDRGLIQVIFKPEKKAVRPEKKAVRPVRQWRPWCLFDNIWRSPDIHPHLCSVSPKGLDETTARDLYGMEGDREERTSAGVTGLTGHSSQGFYTVADLDYDPDGVVTINVRLVCIAAVRPLVAVPRSNPVPAPVE